MRCGAAAFEGPGKAGPDLKIKLVDKAAMARSGAVAQGLSAINTYIGENDPADYVRYVRNDLMGITRDDLAYDLGRNVDDSVHLFEEWGLPIWKTDAEGGPGPSTEGIAAKPLRGRRQAGALGQVADHDQRRILQVDRRRGGEESARHGPHPGARLHRQAGERQERPARIAGAVGFSVRDNTIHVYKAKAVLLAAGGCVNLFRPRSVGEGTGAPGIRCGTPAPPTRWRRKPAPR